MQSMVRLVLLASVLSMPAWAYPWMVKHGYGSCASCHVDPSGSGQLTAYGRAQADVLVRWRLEPRKETEEVPRSAGFLWLFEMPEFLNLSGNARGGALIRPTAKTKVIPLIMATDLYATVNVGQFVGHVTSGVAIKNAGLAAVYPVCDSSKGVCGVQWVAREFWAGAKFADDTVMLRAGRINLPFGLRNNEHTSYVRTMTRTDVNVGQQVGLSVAYNSDVLRGELMGIAGNFQLSPDVYRERGYSGFAEYSLSDKAYLGASSLITASEFDITTGIPTIRHAHGLFARVAPIDRLSILAEADFLAWQSPQQLDRLGFAALAQGDFDLMQGLHLIATLEASHSGSGEKAPSLGGWLSATWYPLPHMELRIDHILRRTTTAATTAAALEYTLLVQLHFFL